MEQQGGPVRVSEETTGRRGHSRMGVASFVIALLATVLIVVGAIIAGSVVQQLFGDANPAGITPQDVQQGIENSPGAAGALTVAAIGLLAGPLLYLLGLILGIVGLVQRRRRRLFAILGTVFNGLPFLAIVAFVVLAIAGAAIATP